MIAYHALKLLISLRINLKVDLALLPYTGVSGYPNCYLNLSHKEKLKEAKRISIERFEILKKLHKQLNQI